MAEISRGTQALAFLRRFPLLYGAIRAVYRKARRWPFEVSRRLLPATQNFGLPRGFYSGAAQVRSGEREGRIVLEGQSAPRFDEQTLVRLSGLHQDGFQPWPIFWLREKDAVLSGESLCLRDGRGRLMAEGTFSVSGDANDPSYRHFARRPETRLTGNVTSLISYWGVGSFGSYWHWLMDAVARLALLPEFPADTRILVRPLQPWRSWFLREMGVESRCVETRAQEVEIEDYYFAGPSSMTGCHNPFAVHFLRDQFLAKGAPTRELPRRFYVIREGFTRNVGNEAEVRAFFQRRGWGLVAPEKLGMPDQIALFARAEAVVALHGSALTNLLWCPPGCRVLEFAPDNFLAGAFEVVARVLDLPHDFMICPGDRRTNIHVDLALLNKKLNALGI